MLRQNGYVKWTDIGMAVIAALLFVALLVMLAEH
jgi:type II secretory pathway component PulK